MKFLVIFSFITVFKHTVEQGYICMELQFELRREKTGLQGFRPGLTNRSVQLQKMVRSMKFWIQEEEKLYYPSSENKGADQLRSNCEADLRLCFRIKIRFSYDEANLIPTNNPKVLYLTIFVVILKLYD